jgi:hypothetical protein
MTPWRADSMCAVRARHFSFRTDKRFRLPASFLLILLLFVVPAFAQEILPARVARLGHLKGKVSFLPNGQDQWSEATLNFTVTENPHSRADNWGHF